MHVFLRIIVIVAAVCFCAPAVAHASARPRSLAEALDSLDAALDRRGAVVAARMRRIDSMHADSGMTPKLRALEIARAYCSLNIDSALTYYCHALDVGPVSASDTIPVTQAAIEYARQLAVRMHFYDAVKILDRVRPHVATRAECLSYYDVRSRAYIDAAEMVASPRLRHEAREMALPYLDTLLTYVASYPGASQMVKAQRLTLQGDSLLASGELFEAFNILKPGTEPYAITAAMLARIYQNHPEKRPEYLYYLAIAATSDAINGNGQAYSLEMLGSEMYKEGNYDRALTYITTAGEAIQQAGARKYGNGGSAPLSIMLRTMRNRDHNRMTLFIVLLTVVLVTVVLLAWMLRRNVLERRRLTRRVSSLDRAARAKDTYIATLFDICGGYIDTMEEYNRLVARKIKANQVKDLYETADSGRYPRVLTERFYENFDNAVANIYPSFVDDINSLLAADKKIELPAGARLTPELRIAAFMRLGVSDSASISKFLGLSLNTVYTYRNRLKSRAVNRDSFESDILKMAFTD